MASLTTPAVGALSASVGEFSVVRDEANKAVLRDDEFYNRVAELESLTTLIANPPTAVIVMTGPPSCGKSGACAAASFHGV